MNQRWTRGRSHWWPMSRCADGCESPSLRRVANPSLLSRSSGPPRSWAIDADGVGGVNTLMHLTSICQWPLDSPRWTAKTSLEELEAPRIGASSHGPTIPPVNECCSDEQGDGEGHLTKPVGDLPVGIATKLPEVGQPRVGPLHRPAHPQSNGLRGSLLAWFLPLTTLAGTDDLGHAQSLACGPDG